MNGDPFFFREKQTSFAKQNIVVFFALSSRPEDMEGRQKWTDFLSRIPVAHRISLPEFKYPLDRIYRPISKMPKDPFAVHRIEAAALLYIGLRKWTSVRELEQAVELAKIRTVGSGCTSLELAHIAVSPQDVEEVEATVKKEFGTIDILGSSDNIIEIT